MPSSFTITRRVQFAETDMAGVVHFANFFRYMEEAEHAFWRSIGESVHARRGVETIGWPRGSAACDYLAPLRHEDEFAVTMGVAELQEKAVVFQFDFALANKCVARGTIRAVCCRIDGGKFESIAIPADIRAKLASHVLRRS